MAPFYSGSTPDESVKSLACGLIETQQVFTDLNLTLNAKKTEFVQEEPHPPRWT